MVKLIFISQRMRTSTSYKKGLRFLSLLTAYILLTINDGTTTPMILENTYWKIYFHHFPVFLCTIDSQILSCHHIWSLLKLHLPDRRHRQGGWNIVGLFLNPLLNSSVLFIIQIIILERVFKLGRARLPAWNDRMGQQPLKMKLDEKCF